MDTGLSWSGLGRSLRRFPKIYRALRELRDRLRHARVRVFRFLPARFDFGPPRGWFYIVNELRKGRVTGRIILERQPDPHITPQSLRALSPLGQAGQMKWPIFWTRHLNARLVGPTLLLVGDRFRIGVESAFGTICVEDDAGYRQFRRPPPTRLEGPWTSIISRWSGGFYHWFMDALPRLSTLKEFPPETRVLVPADLKSYARDTLNWLGLENRILPTSCQHYLVEDYYFSSPTNMTGIFDPYAVQFLRDSFLGRADASYQSPRRFFVRRVGAVRGIVNEEDVLQCFRDRGWEILDTEKMSLARQIQLFTQAEQICTLHGAALTNLVWCRPGCRVLELVSSTFMNAVYEGVAEAAKLDYQYLLCPGRVDYRAEVDVAELKRRLDR